MLLSHKAVYIILPFMWHINLIGQRKSFELYFEMRKIASFVTFPKISNELHIYTIFNIYFFNSNCNNGICLLNLNSIDIWIQQKFNIQNNINSFIDIYSDVFPSFTIYSWNVRILVSLDSSINSWVLKEFSRFLFWITILHNSHSVSF